MKLIVEPDYAALSQSAANIVLAAMLQDRRTNLSLTAGATPVGTYEIVTRTLAANPEAYADAYFYNFDEVPVEGQPEGLTMTALRQQLYGPASVREENLRILTMTTGDAIRDDLRATGGLDLVLMGLGADGHFCANMPGVTRFDADIYTYQVHEGLPFYEDVRHLSDPPASEVITFGAPLILSARQAVLIVSGASKAAALARMVTGEVTPEFPVSVLQLHPNLTVIADEAAAGEL